MRISVFFWKLKSFPAIRGGKFSRSFKISFWDWNAHRLGTSLLCTEKIFPANVLISLS